MQLPPGNGHVQKGVSGAFGSAGTEASGSGLGTVAKSSPTYPPSTGAFDRRLVRAERYALTSEARRLLLNEGRKQGLQWQHKVHRTAGCMYIPHGKVHVHQSCEHGHAFYSGVQVCGSIWGCPICAAKISERRRQEVEQSVSWAYESGLQPMMVTLTFPHQRSDDLGGLLDKQREALKRLRKGRVWDLAKQRWQFQGLVRALEITHSERNGWHPHTHELWFVSSQTTAGDVKNTVMKRWKRICQDVGLLDPKNEQSWRAFDLRAVDVKAWCSAGEYLAKADDAKHWGVDREMAKASSKGTKGGRKAGRHPFKLLAESLDGSERAGQLYVDFIQKVTERRVRALFFSPGLKGRIGIDDQTDEELAEEQRDEAVALGQLTADDWRLIRRLGRQSAVLDAAEVGGWNAIVMLLAGLRDAEGIEQPEAKQQTPEAAQKAADETAAAREQERQEQAAAQSAGRDLDAALARVREQSAAVHVAMLADAQKRLEAFKLAEASGGREATSGVKGAKPLARPQLGTTGRG